jgi:hypothetical protein
MRSSAMPSRSRAGFTRVQRQQHPDVPVGIQHFAAHPRTPGNRLGFLRKRPESSPPTASLCDRRTRPWDRPGRSSADAEQRDRPRRAPPPASRVASSGGSRSSARALPGFAARGARAADAGNPFGFGGNAVEHFSRDGHKEAPTRRFPLRHAAVVILPAQRTPTRVEAFRSRGCHQRSIPSRAATPAS